MSSVKVAVKKILDMYPKARDSVNLCITLYMKLHGIHRVSPSIWGRADTVRREWRYWMNTVKLYPSLNEEERYILSTHYQQEYAKRKNKTEV